MEYKTTLATKYNKYGALEISQKLRQNKNSLSFT